MKRVAVIGSRGFENYDYFRVKLEYLLSEIEDPISYVSGGAKTGADNLIKKYCLENQYTLIEHLPEYDKYSGKVAPIKRNHTIVENSDYLIAFYDGKSRGSKYTIDLAYKKGIPVKIVYI